MTFQEAPRRIFGLVQPTPPTRHSPGRNDTATIKPQEIEGKHSETAQSIVSFLTKRNAETVSDMSRLSYVYDMNGVDQVPRQVFKTQFEASLSHKCKGKQSQDAPLVIEALGKRGQNSFRKENESVRLHSLEEKPRKRIKIFNDISSSEDEKLPVDDSEQHVSKIVDEHVKEGGLFGFSHLMPRMSRLQGSTVSEGKDLSIVEEDLEGDVRVKRLQEDTEDEEFEASENEDKEDTPTLSRKKMAQKAERKIDKQVRAIERMLPKDKN